MITIKPIETRYAGRRFRSRLEARWAVLFDSLGVRWEYEPEGYLLPSGAYLPDFYLPGIGAAGTFFEVKPSNATDDDRWAELADSTGRPVIVAFGMDLPGRGEGRGEGPMEIVYDSEGWDCCREFCLCPDCGRVGIEFEGAGGRICGARPEYPPVHPRVVAAYAAALSARFEHAERTAV